MIGFLLILIAILLFCIGAEINALRHDLARRAGEKTVTGALSSRKSYPTRPADAA